MSGTTGLKNPVATIRTFVVINIQGELGGKIMKITNEVFGLGEIGLVVVSEKNRVVFSDERVPVMAHLIHGVIGASKSLAHRNQRPMSRKLLERRIGAIASVEDLVPVNALLLQTVASLQTRGSGADDKVIKKLRLRV